MPRNPHFDDNRVLWNDAYSGEYEPVAYDQQFDDQWRLFLEKKTGFHHHTGVETADTWIDERICELTGVPHFLLKKKYGPLTPLALLFNYLRRFTKKRLAVGGVLQLEPKFPIDFFRGKACLDIGCGAGRWSKTLQALGGKVTAIDVSRHGLLSTKKFIDDVRELSLFDIPTASPSLHKAFDFSICWGVIMCTHDPKTAFELAASTVKKGGHLYIMVYAPMGMHGSERVLAWRKQYREQCRTFEEKLNFAYSISRIPEDAINRLDMLNTFYNWVIDEPTIINWFQQNGFDEIIFLNKDEQRKCAHHVLAKKTKD